MRKDTCQACDFANLGLRDLDGTAAGGDGSAGVAFGNEALSEGHGIIQGKR